MDNTTAIMSLLGGILLILYAVRLLVQKRQILNRGLEIKGKVVGFSGRHAIYRFVYEGKTYTASSLQRISNKSQRMNAVEEVRFNPEIPKFVVVPGNRHVEINSSFMILFGLLAITGGILTVFR